MSYFALVDCNNFYASCQRAFRPDLEGKPIVVLSNNDGCIVARSSEAKALGEIPVGQPFFKIKHLLKAHNIHVFSSNYQLYGDMSERVMTILKQFVSKVEVYSIDEAFLKLDFLKQDEQQLFQFCIQLRRVIRQWTGIPVSIGLGNTKTLAKLANRIAKKNREEGVFIFEKNKSYREVLKELSVGKVWGIGNRSAHRLDHFFDIKTIFELMQVREQWMRKEFGVTGLRTLRELKGFPCYVLENPDAGRKNLLVSRSFRKDVNELSELTEAISVFTSLLGEKLRKFHYRAGVLTVFIRANKHRNKRPDGRYYFSQSLELPIPTSNTNRLITHATDMVRQLFDKATNYKKAGIIASYLRPEESLQGHLFESEKEEIRLQSLMKTMDAINKKNGRNTVYFSSCGSHHGWRMFCEMRSPNYTTSWKDIPEIG